MSKKKPLIVKIEGEIKILSGGAFYSKVVKSGNGAVIPAFKRFIGEKVLVIIRRTIKMNKISKKERNQRIQDGLELGHDLDIMKDDD